ncbi:MAG: hypothetical protein KC680_03400 [Candidatus Peregrinibacteria bacterium]|nr:hypothetical protein [Candidatus Peregrinibacteria bacterium]
MTPREIIAKAWAMTKKEKLLRRWGFSSALLQTLLNVKLLTYQSWFFYLYVIKGETISFFAMEELFLRYMPASAAWTLIIIIFSMVAIEIVFPHFAQGAVIGLAAKSYKKQDVRGGLVLALYNFLPIFIVHELFVLSGLSTVITIASLMLRYGPEGDFILLPIGLLGFMWLFSNILQFFSAFAEESIVIHKAGPFEAIGRSIKLIISHLGHVVFLLILMFVISLRILINIVMILLIPGIVMGIGLLLAEFLSPTLSYTLGGLIGLALVVVASYFFAYITVFKQTVWTITYLELSCLKDLDIIEDEEKQEE